MAKGRKTKVAKEEIAKTQTDGANARREEVERIPVDDTQLETPVRPEDPEARDEAAPTTPPKSDHKTWGNKDIFKTMFTSSSESENFAESVDAMEIPGYGCLVRSSTMAGGYISECMVFVPGVTILERKDEKNDKKIVGRELIIRG